MALFKCNFTKKKKKESQRCPQLHPFRKLDRKQLEQLLSVHKSVYKFACFSAVTSTCTEHFRQTHKPSDNRELDGNRTIMSVCRVSDYVTTEMRTENKARLLGLVLSVWHFTAACFCLHAIKLALSLRASILAAVQPWESDK